MNLTISLDEPAAEQLRRHATAQHLSPEQVASDLLGGVLRHITEEQRWRAANNRRIDLIGKSRAVGLTTEEAAELDRLQAEADQRLAPMDLQLIARAEAFRRLVEQLPDAKAP